MIWSKEVRERIERLESVRERIERLESVRGRIECLESAVFLSHASEWPDYAMPEPVPDCTCRSCRWLEEVHRKSDKNNAALKGTL